MEFLQYTGEYQKKFYDVLLGDTVYPQIWPNGGGWRAGGLVLCSDDNRTDIRIRPSEIHPGEVRMEYTLTIEEYEDAMKDIKAYVEKRKPIAEKEYQDWEEERQRKNHEKYMELRKSRAQIYERHTSTVPRLNKTDRKKKKSLRKMARLNKRKGRRS